MKKVFLAITVIASIALAACSNNANTEETADSINDTTVVDSMAVDTLVAVDTIVK